MIQQFYATHCTYGSSVLNDPKTTKPELANSPLGYSVRAGSMDLDSLIKVYRKAEPFLYYYLPEDVLGAERAQRDAFSAPCRFCYLPSVDGVPMAIRVCYRNQDTAGRVGSYFAHVLLGESKQPWSSLDVLRSWGAADWQSEDSDEIDSSLLPVPKLFVPTHSETGTVDDNSFWAFIQGRYQPRSRYSVQNNSSSDPGADLFVRYMNGVLDCWDDPQKKFILIADPAVAALFFYGVLRLLPPGMGTASAFSTYETHPGQFPGRFSATVFDDPLKKDAAPELYQSGHFVLNTFTHLQTPCRQIEGNYSRKVVRLLRSGGWDAVDRYRKGFVGLNLHKAVDLDRLASMDKLCDSLLAPVFAVVSRSGNASGSGVNLDQSIDSGSDTGLGSGVSAAPPFANKEPIWRQNKMYAGYLQKRLADNLERLNITESTVGTLLRPLTGSSAHLTLLELFGTQSGTPKLNAVVLFLLKNLPRNLVGAWLQFPNPREDSKVAMLLKYISSDGELPPGSEKLVFEGPQTALLAKILVQMDGPRRLAFWNRYSPVHKLELIGGYAQAVAYHKGDVELLERRVGELNSREIVELHRKFGDAFFMEYPIFSSALGERLGALSIQFTDFGQDFSEFYQTLSAGSHLMSESTQERVYNWGRLKTIAGNILQIQDNPATKTDRLESEVKDLMIRFDGATAGTGFEDHAARSRRLFLQRAIRALFPESDGNKTFLPVPNKRNEGLWGKIEWYLELKQWPKSTPKLGSLSDVLGGQALASALSSAMGGSEAAGASVSQPEPPRQPGPASKSDSASKPSSGALPPSGGTLSSIPPGNSPVPPPVAGFRNFGSVSGESGDVGVESTGGSSSVSPSSTSPSSGTGSGAFGGNLTKSSLPPLPPKTIPDPMVPESMQTDVLGVPPKGRKPGKVRLTAFQSLLLCITAIVFLLITGVLLIYFQPGSGAQPGSSGGGTVLQTGNYSDLTPAKPGLSGNVQTSSKDEADLSDILDTTDELGSDDGTMGKTDEQSGDSTGIDQWVIAPETGDPIPEGEEQTDQLSDLAGSIILDAENRPTVMARLQTLRVPTQDQWLREFNLLKRSAAPVQGLARRAKFGPSGSVDLVRNKVVDAVNISNLKLGPGYLNVGGKLFLWAPGDIFKPENPVTEYRLRDLEKALGLGELKLELIKEVTTVRLQLSAKAPVITVKKKDKKNQTISLKQREEEYELLERRLKEYQSDRIGQKAKEGILKTMAQMVQLNYASASEAPQKSSFGTDQAAYETAMEQYRVQSEAQDKIRRAIVPKVQETLLALKDEIGRLSDQVNSAQKVADDSAQQTLLDLLASVRETAFVVYCPNGFRGSLGVANVDSPFDTMPEEPNPAARANSADGELIDESVDANIGEGNVGHADAASDVGKTADRETVSETVLDPFAEPGKEETSFVAPANGGASDSRRSLSGGEAGKPANLSARPGLTAGREAGSDGLDPFDVLTRPENGGGAAQNGESGASELQLSGQWQEMSIKQDRTIQQKPGVFAIADVSIICEGRSKGAMYSKWRGNVKKNYDFESCLILDYGQNRDYDQDKGKYPYVAGLYNKHTVYVGAKRFAVRYRIVSKEDSSKAFVTPWYTRNQIDLNMVYSLSFELDQASIERLMAK